MNNTLVEKIGATLAAASLTVSPGYVLASHGTYDCERDSKRKIETLNEIDKTWDHSRPMPWLVWFHSNATKDFIDCMGQKIEVQTQGKYTLRYVGQKGDKYYYGFTNDRRLDEYFEKLENSQKQIIENFKYKKNRKLDGIIKNYEKALNEVYWNDDSYERDCKLLKIVRPYSAKTIF